MEMCVVGQLVGVFMPPTLYPLPQRMEGYSNFLLNENVLNRQKQVGRTQETIHILNQLQHTSRCRHVCPSACLAVCLNVYRSVYLYVCPFVCLTVGVTVCMTTKISETITSRATKLTVNFYYSCTHIKLVLELDHAPFRPYKLIKTECQASF